MVRAFGTLLDLGLAGRAVAAPPARILVCGDADCSYSSAMAQRLGAAASGLCATTYEPEDGLLQRYPYAVDALETLRRLGARLRCGVDARQLREHFPDEEPWERVVFNLPQAPPLPGARNQIQRHRALLREFCASAQEQLTEDGQVWITLLTGQGGTPLDPIQRSHGDTWQLQHEAARAGLLVSAVMVADVEALATAGYIPTGRRPKDGVEGGVSRLGKKRAGKGMVVHVLTRAATAAATASADGGAESGGSSSGAGDGDGGNRGVAPLEWVFDNSFWLGDGGAPVPDAQQLWATGAAALRDAERHALTAPPRLLDAYERPEDGRIARTYRFQYSSDRLALSREAALELNGRVCEAVVAEHGARHRTGADEDDDAAVAAAATSDAAAAAMPTAASPDAASTKVADGDGDGDGGEATPKPTARASDAQPSGEDGGSGGSGGGEADAAAVEERGTGGGDAAVAAVAGEEPGEAAPPTAPTAQQREPLYGGRWRQDRGGAVS